MATKNIVPRGNLEGNLGTEQKRWSGAFVGNLDVSGNTKLTFANGVITDIATQAQAEGGVDNTKIMTPLQTKNAIDYNNATNRLPNASYVVGNVVYNRSNLFVALKCTQSGTTSNTELDISDNNVTDTVTDGSVVWKVISRDTLEALPLNGGTLTGVIVIDRDTAHICKTNNQGRTIIRGGTSSSNDGASLYLYGNNYSNDEDVKGGFELTVRNANGQGGILAGMPNGDLTWYGAEVVTAYEAGDTISDNLGVYLCGLLNSDTVIDVVLPLSKPINANSAEIKSGSVYIKQNGATFSSNLDVMQFNPVCYITRSGLRIRLTNSSSWGGTKADSIVVQFASLSISFK